MKVKKETLNVRTIITFLLLVAVVPAVIAQKDAVTATYTIMKDGRAHVTQLKNNLDYPVKVTLTNDDRKTAPYSLKAYESQPVDKICILISYQSSQGGGTVWKRKTEANLRQAVVEEQELGKEQENIQSSKLPVSNVPSVDQKDKQTQMKSFEVAQQTDPFSKQEVIDLFNDFLETKPFYSLATIDQEEKNISEHITNLKNWKNKDAYIAEHHLNTYIRVTRDSLKSNRENVVSLAYEYMDKYNGHVVENRDLCIESIKSVIRQRLDMREANLKLLEEEIEKQSETKSFSLKDINWLIVCSCGGLLLLCTILMIWYKKTKKKQMQYQVAQQTQADSGTDAASNIVVRRKTTSILRKQSLEDVIDNEAYLKIACNDFCDDSAVRQIYIKNTCVKDIYNMYAEDLRNPNNPKEDGCMVLGRWVHDSERNDYYVSLEQIVLPGDDAVFAEYELNFGGKIKLKVTEKLRKLRKETNLQYDLTCWVHSHPGLGVFFSNSDSNVQMQLKHPTHPNFLTAIVVDILTPQQEFGIFTFKRDSSINSKADLKKLYSLEDLYKWAVESNRHSFKPEDYYNTLTDAKMHVDECYGIELSNGAVIDMGKLAAEETPGFVGMVHGFRYEQIQKTENIAISVTKTEVIRDNELLGCFIIATHCSIPSIKKVIASYIGKIKFVLVYTSSDGLLTSIPIANQDICTDENYYGEQKLEDLKIWTRRKR